MRLPAHFLFLHTQKHTQEFLLHAPVFVSVRSGRAPCRMPIGILVALQEILLILEPTRTHMPM
jgi:hypothetical protein